MTEWGDEVIWKSKRDCPRNPKGLLKVAYSDGSIWIYCKNFKMQIFGKLDDTEQLGCKLAKRKCLHYYSKY